MVGNTNEPQNGNRISDQETNPGRISKARLVRMGWRRKYFFTIEKVLYRSRGEKRNKCGEFSKGADFCSQH